MMLRHNPSPTSSFPSFSRVLFARKFIHLSEMCVTLFPHIPFFLYFKIPEWQIVKKPKTKKHANSFIRRNYPSGRHHRARAEPTDFGKVATAVRRMEETVFTVLQLQQPVDCQY